MRPQHEGGIFTIQILKKNELFFQIEDHNIQTVLKCLGSREKDFKKGEFIFLAGETAPSVGLMLSGKAQIIKENVFGDSMIISTLKSGDLFGETFACMGQKVMPVSVEALENCTVLFLDVDRIVHTCGSSCPFHYQLISNLLRIISVKNEKLNRKMSYLSNKTIRTRLEAYFLDQMNSGGSVDFTVPFSLTELAEYLCVDRSAMSRELSHMKKEGILDFSGRNFHWSERSV